jgi:hypothetical protein
MENSGNETHEKPCLDPAHKADFENHLADIHEALDLMVTARDLLREPLRFIEREVGYCRCQKEVINDKKDTFQDHFENFVSCYGELAAIRELLIDAAYFIKASVGYCMCMNSKIRLEMIERGEL